MQKTWKKTRNSERERERDNEDTVQKRRESLVENNATNDGTAVQRTMAQLQVLAYKF